MRAEQQEQRVGVENGGAYISVQDLAIRFQRPSDPEPFFAVRGFSLEVGRGEFLAIVGPSGCGKSTTLFAIDGLYPPAHGKILVDGELVVAPRPDRAMVFQEFALLPWRDVASNIWFPLELKGVPERQRRQIAERYVELVGLRGFGASFPHQLSGGMKQRVGIARAFASGADILLMDEPFAAVDAQTRDIMGVELLRVWSEEKKTILFVTHSIDEAVYLGDRVAIITAGPGRVKEIVDINIERPRSLDVRNTPEFVDYRRYIWESLKEEVLKSPQFSSVAL